MVKYYLVAILAVVVTVLAQVYLKKGANYGRSKNSHASMFLNVNTIMGYFLFVIVTLLSLYALQKLDLKEMVFIIPMSYLFIPLVSKKYFNEHLSQRRIIGTVVIFFGIVIFNLDKVI